MCESTTQLAGVSFLWLVLRKHMNRYEGKACIPSPAAGHMKMYLQYSLVGK